MQRRAVAEVMVRDSQGPARLCYTRCVCCCPLTAHASPWACRTAAGPATMCPWCATSACSCNRRCRRKHSVHLMSNKKGYNSL
eukprot:scaffold129475_cov20-Tisochrysis_lutea.AAC.2